MLSKMQQKNSLAQKKADKQRAKEIVGKIKSRVTRIKSSMVNRVKRFQKKYRAKMREMRQKYKKQLKDADAECDARESDWKKQKKLLMKTALTKPDSGESMKKKDDQ